VCIEADVAGGEADAFDGVAWAVHTDSPDSSIYDRAPLGGARASSYQVRRVCFR
jgi:hypothetical protein